MDPHTPSQMVGVILWCISRVSMGEMWNQGAVNCEWYERSILRDMNIWPEIHMFVIDYRHIWIKSNISNNELMVLMLFLNKFDTMELPRVVKNVTDILD